jgi:Outer membrane lipoprotein carrier protein LolA-like
MMMRNACLCACSVALTLAAIAAAGAPRKSAPPPTPTPAALQGSGDLDAVLAQLAMRKHGHVEFIEQKFIAALDRPIESSGEMRFDAPDHLEQRTLKPRAETLILDNGTLTVDRGRTHRSMDMHAFPQVEPLVESIRATLAGDRAGLERIFHLEFSGSMARWTLTLVPLESKVKQLVAHVKIDGVRDQLIKVEIRQTDGDRSLMTLRPSLVP